MKNFALIINFEEKQSIWTKTKREPYRIFVSEAMYSKFKQTKQMIEGLTPKG